MSPRTSGPGSGQPPTDCPPSSARAGRGPPSSSGPTGPGTSRSDSGRPVPTARARVVPARRGWCTGPSRIPGTSCARSPPCRTAAPTCGSRTPSAAGDGRTARCRRISRSAWATTRAGPTSRHIPPRTGAHPDTAIPSVQDAGSARANIACNGCPRRRVSSSTSTNATPPTKPLPRLQPLVREAPKGTPPGHRCSLSPRGSGQLKSSWATSWRAASVTEPDRVG